MRCFMVWSWWFVASTIASPVLAASLADTEKEYGDAWADMGNWGKAVEHYRKAAGLDPSATELRLKLANGLFQAGDKAGALAEIVALQKAEPGSAVIACAAGVIQLDRGKVEEACQSFKQALAINPNQARAVFGEGQCHQARFQKDKSEKEKDLAVAAFESYLKLFPDGPHALPAKDALEKLRYGEAGATMATAKEACAAGKFRLAEQTLRQVTKQHPEFEEAHYLLGMALSSPVINNVTEAVEEWKKAPHLKEALLQRGVLAFGDEELGEAVDLLQKAVALDPNYAEPHYQLGLVYREQMKDGDAKAEFSKVVSLAPNTALAEQANTKLQVMTGNVMFLREGEVIDAASEVEIGRKICEQIDKQFGLAKDPKLQERLDRILRRITANSDRLPEATPFHVKLVNVDGINALSFTGGTIYVFKGLIDFIRRELEDSDDAYAAVLGHEVAHVAMRHGLGMLDLAGGAKQLVDGQSLDVRSLDTLMVGMSRKHEFEADQVGSLYAYRAGFDPAAALRFHAKLLSTGKEVPEGLDHPTHGERSERLREYLLGLRTKARHFDAGVTSLDSRDYEAAVIHFEIFLGLFPNSLAGRNNLAVAKHHLAMAVSKREGRFKLSTDIDPRSQVKPIRVRGADVPDPGRPLMVEAADVFRGIVDRDRGYLPARINLGSCLLALGETAEGKKVLEEAVRDSPKSPEARNNLAVARLLQQDSPAGLALLRELVAGNPNFPDAYYNLALALQQTGDKDEARKNWIAYLARDEKSGWAEQAKAYLAQLK